MVLSLISAGNNAGEPLGTVAPNMWSPNKLTQTAMSQDINWSDPFMVRNEDLSQAPMYLDKADSDTASEPHLTNLTPTPPAQTAQKVVVGGKGKGQEGKSIEEELCTICGDRASGYHYNALSCEGCKGFFRRSITRRAEYVCKQGGNCEMDMWMRRRCQACRMRRCREVGMKEECLLSDEQCRARDVRRKIKLQHKKKVVEPELSQPSPEPKSITTISFTEPAPLNGNTEVDPMGMLSEHDRELIYCLLRSQDMFELPREEDIQQVTKVRVSDVGRPKQLNETIYKQMAEMTILVTQLVVEFAKNMPGFLQCDKEDQITLLKGSASEVMMLRSARRYDVETDTIIFGNGMPYTRDNMRMAGLNDYVESLFNFCRKMGVMAVDNTEYAMLTAACIFSDRLGLQDPHKVETCQETYILALQDYVRHRRPKSSQHFAKLLMMLTDLREASIEHAEVLFSLKVEKGSLPPLLTEYFDVVDPNS